LDICISKSQKHTDLIRYFDGVHFKFLKRMKDVVSLRAVSVTITSEKKKIPAAIDGEYSGSLPVESSVQKAGLPFIVP